MLRRNPPLPFALQSSTELVKLRVKQGGPPSKAKYYLTTDSEPVGRLNDEKYPFKGCEKYLKPCTYKQRVVGSIPTSPTIKFNAKI